MRRATCALVMACGLVAVGCGNDDDAETAVPANGSRGAEQAPSGPGTERDDADGVANEAADGAGSITIDGEAIQMDSLGCHLEEQERVGLGGTLELTALGGGHNAAGERVDVDIARVRPDPDSVLSETDHDRVWIHIGDVGNPRTYDFEGDVGSVTVDGNTLTATGLVASGPDGAIDVNLDLACTAF